MATVAFDSNYLTIALISHTCKVMLKILQAIEKARLWSPEVPCESRPSGWGGRRPEMTQREESAMSAEPTQVLLWANDGAGEFSTLVTCPTALCDGRWHRLAGELVPLPAGGRDTPDPHLLQSSLEGLTRQGFLERRCQCGPRQEFWSGLPFPSSGGLPDPG